jgi:hypothetical protein
MTAVMFDATSMRKEMRNRIGSWDVIHDATVWSKRMKVERFSPDPDTEPRHWVRHDQASQ